MHDITRVPPRARKYYQTTSIQTRPVTKGEASRGRWLVGFGTGMLIIVGLLLIISQVILPWYTSMVENWTYGSAHVYHIQVDVGRGGMSDVYTMNAQDSIEVLILTGNKAEVYAYPVSASGLMVTVRPQKNGHTHRTDLLLHIVGVDLDMLLLNTGTSFKLIH